jgi:hypothetical protein
VDVLGEFHDLWEEVAGDRGAVKDGTGRFNLKGLRLRLCSVLLATIDRHTGGVAERRRI